jgi:predicted methyltransferase
MTRVLVPLLLLVASFAQAADDSEVQTKLDAAMAADIRTESEVKRDANRKPAATLEFFGLQDDMTVVELLPGGGWYTKLLAPVLAENGQYYVALGTGRVQESVLSLEGFEDVQVVAQDANIFRPEGSRSYAIEFDGLGVDDVDIVFTFRNYHNFGPEGRAAMNSAVFDALKPGGIYAVVDHTRRHMESDGHENRRRIDPVQAILEIEAAGFEFVDYSDLHYRPDDQLVYEVGRKTVTGNTDRWTLKFIKPLE